MKPLSAGIAGRISWRSLYERARSTPVARWTYSDRRLVIFRIDRPLDLSFAVLSVPVKRNDWSHLERFEATEHWLSREGFLATVAERLSHGEHVYSIADDKRLLSYGWLVPRQETSWLPAVEQELRYPPDSAVMYNAYTHPAARGRGYHGLVTRARISDAFREFGALAVFTAVEPRNSAAMQAKDGSGMSPWMELSCRRRLGRAVKSQRFL